MMVESLSEILIKRKSQDVLQQPLDVSCAINVVGESFSSITISNIVNQLGKHDLFCGSLVNNLKSRKLFSDQMNRNCFTQLLLGATGIASPCRI